ncbi:phage tail tape measure protein [Vibrio vulnificus]|nr:phage tail tape measure protein [Vibrio vulnificus]
MKVEQQTNEITPSHKGVVFANEQTAKQKDMTQAIGRFDEPRRSIVFINDNGLGTKYKALMSNGMALHLTKDDRNNYYVTDLLDNISKTGLNENKETDEYDSADIDKVDANTDEDDQRPVIYKEEQDFLEQDIDSAMDLDFTTEDLGFEHRVGMYNEHTNTYTLREDVKDLLDEFEFDIDETEDGVVAHVLNESINARKLIQLIRLLKQQEQEDENELKEAIESDCVQVNALAKVKSLLNHIRLAQKHGDVKESDGAELELRELLDSYRDANPPANGIEKVEAELDDVLTKSEQTAQQRHNSLPKGTQMANHKKARERRKATKRQQSKKRKSNSQAKSMAKKAGKSIANATVDMILNPTNESLDEQMRKRAEKARATMSILEAQGIQVRGQVFNG